MPVLALDGVSSGSPNMSEGVSTETQTPGVSAVPCTGSSSSSVVGSRPALQFVFETMHTDVLYDGKTCVEVAEVIMDSGATKHAFNSKEMFVPQSILPYVGERGETLFVHTGKGQVVIEGVGTVRFYGENGQLAESKSCLHVPLLDVNVVSLSELTANGGGVHMISNSGGVLASCVCD
jgi:hypothetical protein